MPPPPREPDDDGAPPSSDPRPVPLRPASERPDPFAPRRAPRVRDAAEEDARTDAERARARQPAIVVAVLAGVLVTAAITWKSVTRPLPTASSQPPIVPAKKKGPKVAASAAAAPDAGPGRCAPVAEPFVLGEPPKVAEPVDPDAGPPEPGLAPFAIEVGRGAVFDAGFAVGVLRDQDGGSVASVATVGPDGQGGKLVKLARSRGDMNAPVVVGRGGALLAALLEPDASGRAIKLAKVEGDHVTWGPVLSEGRDESLAIDLATSGPRAVVAWDDLSKDQKRSQVLLASFDPASMRAATEARPVSGPKTDAEAPRVVPRPGGYWLGWVARGDAPQKPKASAEPPPKKPKDKAKAKHDDDDDEDTGYAAETIDARWVEIVPLDEAGAPTAPPKAVTPKDGHVLAFDLGALGGGDALVVFRDDDTPSGSSGGRVSSVVVRLGGPGEPWVIADEGLGSGAPVIVPGWLAIADVSGGTRLAGLDDKGELTSEIGVEPSLFGGEILASGPGGLLLARPLGRAVRLFVVRCGPAPTPPATPSPSP
jgi:hypothetical protein